VARPGARALRDHAGGRARPRVSPHRRRQVQPRFLASFFLHVPIGVSFIRALNAEEGLTRGDIIKGAAYTVGFAVVAIGGPNIIGSDKNSPYAFTPAQMGPHDVQLA
jgi:hypothetical protein